MNMGLIGVLGMLQAANSPPQIPTGEQAIPAIDSSSEYVAQIEFYLKRTVEKRGYNTDLGNFVTCWREEFFSNSDELEVIFCNAISKEGMGRLLRIVKTDPKGKSSEASDEGATGKVTKCAYVRGDNIISGVNEGCNDYYLPLLKPIRDALKKAYGR